VTTIEGLATEGRAACAAEAFIDHDAFQCGYCTPGQRSARPPAALIAEGKRRSADEIANQSGNICPLRRVHQIVRGDPAAMGES